MKTDIPLTYKAYQLFENSYQETENQTYPITGLNKNVFKNRDVARVPAVYNFNNYIKKHNLHANKLLSFAGKNDWECLILPKKLWHNFEFDENPEKHDVQTFNFQEKDYDFCILTQTFEHIVDIPSSIEKIYEHLTPGGYFFCNWPVNNIRHYEPFHFFTGITVTYINYLMLKTGFNIVECGAWGNKEYIDFIFSKHIWPDYTQIDLKNDNQCPCIGWVLGQK